MDDLPDRRFVRLRLHAEDHPSATVTFLAADPAAPPTMENHGVLARVAESDPERAAQLQAALQALIAREAEVLGWIESDPANAHAFLRDPRGAIQAALPDLPDFFAGWKA